MRSPVVIVDVTHTIAITGAVALWLMGPGVLGVDRAAMCSIVSSDSRLADIKIHLTESSRQTH